MLVSAIEEMQIAASPLAERIAVFTRASDRKRAAAEADPFLHRFFDRVPADIARSFTPLQLDAIKMVFGASL